MPKGIGYGKRTPKKMNESSGHGGKVQNDRFTGYGILKPGGQGGKYDNLPVGPANPLDVIKKLIPKKKKPK